MIRFLTQPINQKSVREDHYAVSRYIAEFYCTISNIGFFIVGFLLRDYVALLAGTLSVLSHAFPYQRLHDLDMMGCLFIGGKFVLGYYSWEPLPLFFVSFAMYINILDTIISRSEKDQVFYVKLHVLNDPTLHVLNDPTLHVLNDPALHVLNDPTLHVGWHIAAAFALYMLN